MQYAAVTYLGYFRLAEIHQALNMKFLVHILLILVAGPVLAQQDPLYSQYMQNPLTINPSYAGFNNILNVMVGYRTQWSGLEGHPQTMSASVHTSLVSNKMGTGIFVLNDRVGNISNIETNISVSYKLDLGKRIHPFEKVFHGRLPRF